MSDTKCETE